MKDMVHRAGRDAAFEIDSAAVSREEIGNGYILRRGGSWRGMGSAAAIIGRGR